MTVHRWIVVAALVGCAACGKTGGPVASYGPWEGTITVADGTTTVRNLSGAVWGGPARLVPELSIGVAEGPDEYMLGSIRGVATDGDRILVVDASIPVIRVYDAAGSYLEDWGRAGQGPGEYLAPSRIDRGRDGRFYVLDQGQYRIVTFDPDGQPAGDLALDSGSKTSQPIVAAAGRVWWHASVDRTQPGLLGWGYKGYAAGEPVLARRGPEIAFNPSVLIGPGPPCVTWPVPYTPQYVSTMLADGSIAAGTGESYRIVVDEGDGRRVVLERSWEPARLMPEQRAWRRRHEHAFALYACGGGWSWNGPDLPDSYPAFQEIVATQSGELWVIRQTGSDRVPDNQCDGNPELDGSRPGPPCWLDRRAIDAFGADGRYLGEVILPTELGWQDLLSSWIEDETVIAPVTDNDGVVHVRKYRLVLAQPA